MAEREVRIKFTGEAGVLKGQAGELRTLFGNLVNDTGDVRDAGAKWADAYSQQSRRIRQDMDDVVTSADVLADSLGPEMVAALEKSGRSVEDQVQELLKLGLTHDDIRVSSDELAAAIRERDDVLRQGAGTVGDGMRKVADETSRAKDINASFIGNAVTELPGIGDAFGPANEAISQFVENLIVGDVNLRSLAGGGALIGGVALAMGLVTQAQADWQKKQEEQKKQSEEFAEALKSTGDAVDGMVAKWREAGKVELWTGFDSGVQDILPTLDKFGLKITDLEKFIREDFNEVTGRGREAFNEWVLGMEAAGVTSEELTPLIEAVARAHDDAAAAEEGAALANRVFTMSQADASEAVNDFLRNKDPLSEFPEEFARMARAMSNGTTPAAADLERVTEELGITTDQALQIASDYADTLRDDQVAALQAAQQAEADLIDARRSAIDTAYGVRSAQDSYTEALERALAATDDTTTTVDEYRQAQDDAAQAALSLADAVVADARAKAEANGQTLSAADANQIMIEQLYGMALALGPDSPLRAALIDHIHTLQGVPENVGTTVTVAGDPDVIVKLGGLQKAAEDVPGEVQTDAAADVETALGQIDDLTVAIEGVPTEHTTSFVIDTDPAMRKLRALKDLLEDVRDAARDAEREVSRVAD